MPATKRPPVGGGPGADFARLIIRTRQARGLSQHQAARLADVTRTTIMRWESGRASKPAPDQLRRVCEALNLNPLDALAALGYLSSSDIGVAA